jgi:hypothetical protein
MECREDQIGNEKQEMCPLAIQNNITAKASTVGFAVWLGAFIE